MSHKKWLVGSTLLLGAVVFLTEPVIVAAQDAATTATARGGRGPREGRGRGSSFGIHRAALEVSGLTAEQKEKIQKLETETRAKMQEARTKAGAAGGGRGSWNTPEIQKLITEARAQVDAILTDEQKKELEAKLAERSGRWSDRGTTSTADKQ